MENPMFQKLLAKKKAEGKGISAVHKDAKSSVLDDLMEHLGGMGMDKINGMKKISVASDSKMGLSKGLEKAKELISKDPAEAMQGDDEMSEDGSNDPEAEGSQMEEAGESSDEESSEDKSPEEMKAEIEELKAKIAAMRG